VGDQGFDFDTSERREARKFEPPPWERDQFERLARERAEQEAAEAKARAALAEREPAAAPTTSVEGPVPEGLAANGRPEDVVFPVGERTDVAGIPIHRHADDPEIAAMIVELKAEEPPALQDTWMIAAMSAIVLAAVGMVLLVWGLAGAAKTGAKPIGALGGMILALLGMGFCGMGAWLGFRTLRQRGVL